MSAVPPEGVDLRETRPSTPDQPLSELVANLTEDTSRLFRQEVALVRAEMKQEAGVAARGAAMMAVAGAFAAVALILASFAIAEGLQRWLDIDLAWCYLIVGVLWVIVAGALYSVGRRTLREVNPKPERTVDSLRDVTDTLKGQR